MRGLACRRAARRRACQGRHVIGGGGRREGCVSGLVAEVKSMLGRTWTDQIGGRVWLRASEPLMLRGPGSESVGSSRSARRLAGERGKTSGGVPCASCSRLRKGGVFLGNLK